MKRLFILKAGTTFPSTERNFGDFDLWTASAFREEDIKVCIQDVEHGADPPNPEDCSGVVITGSHSMVTDDLPWSVRLEQWLPLLLDAGIPLLGICYGHQLLARAAGGKVGFHPQGKEIGTVKIHLSPECAGDAIFGSFPRSFAAHVTHSQTVLGLPPGAVLLAFNDFEPNHAFRLGECAWGVQFHPEYTADIMRSYISEQAEELGAAGLSASELLGSVSETPFAAETLKRFARFVKARLGDKPGEEGRS